MTAWYSQYKDEQHIYSQFMTAWDNQNKDEQHMANPWRQT